MIKNFSINDLPSCPNTQSFWIQKQMFDKIFSHFFFLNVFEQKPSSQKMYLSGYGVELAIKSTEYKALDDTQVKSKFILYIWVKKIRGLHTSI